MIWQKFCKNQPPSSDSSPTHQLPHTMHKLGEPLHLTDILDYDSVLENMGELAGSMASRGDRIKIPSDLINNPIYIESYYRSFGREDGIEIRSINYSSNIDYMIGWILGRHAVTFMHGINDSEIMGYIRGRTGLMPDFKIWKHRTEKFAIGWYAGRGIFDTQQNILTDSAITKMVTFEAYQKWYFAFRDAWLNDPDLDC